MLKQNPIKALGILGAVVNIYNLGAFFNKQNLITMQTKLALACLLACILACQPSTEDLSPTDPHSHESHEHLDIQEFTGSPELLQRLSTPMKIKSKRRSAGDYKVVAYMMEYIGTGEDGEAGATVFFNNRGNKRLGGDFVPFLALDGTANISYSVDDDRPSEDVSSAASNAAIDRAMNTWDRVRCSDLGMFEIADPAGVTGGFIADLFGFEGDRSYTADVHHAGWMPADFFDLLAPGGSNFILGVTFTIVFTDNNGNLIDLDNNRRYDVAWREIYYNDAFSWSVDSHYHIETIALHEAGHGLSQGHFGKAFATESNGKLHFSPRAVMNAAYSGIQTRIARSDKAGHCSDWASWPER